MTTNSGQATFQDRIDPLVEALMKGLLETASHPKAASRTEDAIEAALAEAFMTSLIPPAGSVSQASSFDKAILAAALAPALAEALAPAIAKALDTLGSPKETGQESGSKESSSKQASKRGNKGLSGVRERKSTLRPRNSRITLLAVHQFR